MTPILIPEVVRSKIVFKTQFLRRIHDRQIKSFEDYTNLKQFYFMQYLQFAFLTVICWGTYEFVCTSAPVIWVIKRMVGSWLFFGLAWLIFSLQWWPSYHFETQGWKCCFLDIPNQRLAMVFNCRHFRVRSELWVFYLLLERCHRLLMYR